MYPRNAASPPRLSIGPVVQISDGAIQTSGCTVRILPEGGVEGDGAGTTAYSTDGIVVYTPTQAETNYTAFVLIAKKTGCIPATISVVTTANATAGRVDVGSVAGTEQTAGDIYAELTVIDGKVSNIANVGSPSYAAPSSYTLTTGNQTSGTYANVDSANQTYHVHTDTAGTLSLTYHFTLRPDEQASTVLFSGRFNGTNDTLIFEVYDWVGAAYVQWFTQAGVAGTTSASDFAKTIPALVAKYTSTAANGGGTPGKVDIRIRGTGLTSCTLSVDQLVVGVSNTSRTVGYSQGAIWVDSTGTSGTTPYVNGTADNACPWADALTLATALNMRRFVIEPATTITLNASLSGKTLSGTGWFLALGGQQLTGVTFFGAERVTGTCTKSGTESWFHNCEFGACSLSEFDAYNCALSNTLTLTEATSYKLDKCYAINIGDGWPIIDFGSAVGATGCCLTAWQGYLTIKNMKTGDVLEITGAGDLTIDSSCTGGTVLIAGAFSLTNNGSGQTITQTARYETSQNHGVDWSNVANKTSTVALTNTSTNDSPGVTEALTRIPDATAGSAGGLLIAGSNAATTFASLSVTGVMSWGSWTINSVTSYAGTVAFPTAWPANWSWSTHSAADVWSVATRTLTANTNLGLPASWPSTWPSSWNWSTHSAADVWSATTRTLSAFAFTVAATGNWSTHSAADVWIAATRTLTSGAAPSVAEIDTQLSGTHGSGLWGSTTGGSLTQTVTVTDGTDPIPNARVDILSGSTLVDTKTTNASGIATPSCDAGSYTLRVTASGYASSSSTITVTIAAARSVTLSAISVTASAPGAVTGYVLCLSTAGAAQAGVSCQLEIVNGPGTAGQALSGTVRTVTSGVDGVAQWPGIVWGSQVRYKCGTGGWVRDTAPTSGTTWAMNEVVGEY